MQFKFGRSREDNTRARRSKFGVSSLVVGLILGLVSTLAGLAVLNQTRVDPTWERTVGEVVDSSSRISDNGTLYSPIVGYYVNGQYYTVKSQSSASNRPAIGKQLEVAYDKSSPDKATVVAGFTTEWMRWIFVVIGVVLLLGVPVLFIRSQNRSKVIDKLLQTGRKLSGVLVNVRITGSTKRGNLYRVTVAATDGAGMTRQYESDVVTGGIVSLDVAVSLRDEPVPMDVYVNPANTEEYYVDISGLPDLSLTADHIDRFLRAYKR